MIGMFKDNNGVIPLVDLGYFLGFEKAESIEGKKIVVTEFFNVLNGFIVDSVEWIHHFVWENVINANDVMKTIDQKYIISIVKPDGERMVPLLDYETIILDLCPELGANEMRKISEQQYDGSGQRILVAEDSPSVRNMLVTELVELGFDVVSAADGKEAIAVLEKDQNFNLVISDVEMPQMDGLALTTAIRSSSELADLPVIVYSSIGDIGMKARAEFLKADAHVTKLSVEELMEQVVQFAGGEITQQKVKEVIDSEPVQESVSPEPVDAVSDQPAESPVQISNSVSESSDAKVDSFAQSTETAVAEPEKPEPEIETKGHIEQFLDSKVQELSDKLEQVGEIAEIIDRVELQENESAEQPAEDEITDVVDTAEDDITEEAAGEDQDKTQVVYAEKIKDLKESNIVVEADRVTVASAKSVTIVDAGNVMIDNIRQPGTERPTVDLLKQREYLQRHRRVEIARGLIG